MILDPRTHHFRINSPSDVVTARRKGLITALDLGFNPPDATKIAVVISELGRNICNYAITGMITIISSNVQNDKHIKIIAEDNGPGIKNLDRVLEGGYTTSKGMGLGISGSKKLMDEFVIKTEPNQGTTITAVKWLR
jgi:serine/threonine-protein kinase RsbT